MNSPYVTIATLLVAGLLVLPLFSLNVKNVLSAVEAFTTILRGSLEPTIQNFEIVVRSAASVLVLVLLLFSALFVNARSYAFALAISVVFVDSQLITDPAMLLPLAALSFLDVVRSGWRKNQISSLGNLRPIASAVMLSFALLAFFLLVAWLLSSKMWSYAEAARSLKVNSPLLAVFIDLFFRNPIGLTFVLGVVIFAIYSLSKDLAESLVIFLRPSPQSALKSLRELVDFGAPISPPLTSLRNALVSLAISPPIYYLITLLLARLDLQIPPPYDSMLRFVIAAQIFTIIWFLISRLTASFEEKEPSLLSTFVGLASVAIVYLILYLAALWHPDYGISVERADEVLRKAILSYYETVLYMGELLLTFMGIAP
ncbi:MAG: hypothetical protein NZ902_03220 [Acidilobaceae archaeon]|nr:hypothetical protein [Acidilobaceae archaeon]MCX8165830.1 hypothetical protein [Acidilobaceae archaeon]MDW7974254.1 hypothetical protein [Sulfolobales archaeon]